jgi:hypothetical protein
MENSSDYLDRLEKELLEKHFIMDKIDRDILNKVDVIGFDVDHTLSIYNNENMSELLYNSFILYLIEHRGYPKILQVHHEDYKNSPNKFTIEQAEAFSFTELIIDIKTANVLRIDEDKVIIKAFHGTKELSNEELCKCYGEARKYEKFEYDKKSEDYMYVASFFEFHAIPIYLFCVQLFEEGELPFIKSLPQIMAHLLESFAFNFGLMDIEKNILKKIDSSGYFFPEIYKNPKKYLHPYKAKDLLKFLKEKGKRIFIATNYYQEYADFILRNTIG